MTIKSATTSYLALNSTTQVEYPWGYKVIPIWYVCEVNPITGELSLQWAEGSFEEACSSMQDNA